MDLFLAYCLVLVWVSVAVARRRASGRKSRLFSAGLAAAWLLLAGLWATDLVRWVYAPPPPPPLRPVHAKVPPPALEPSVAPAPGARLFATDLVITAAQPAVAVNGLLPAVGPFPDQYLPRLRGAAGSAVLLRVPAQSGLRQLRMSFSVRLHQRNRAELAVLLNDRVVGTFRVGGTAWRDETIDLAVPDGDNVIELQDAPLHNEPDWRDYLERYPDVRRNLISLSIPLEAGAEAHYEAAGKPEGRTLQFVDTLPPKPDSYTFLFRQLRLEGFR